MRGQVARASCDGRPLPVARKTHLVEGTTPMAATRLRVYYGPDQDTAALAPSEHKRETVTVSLGEIFPLLADAVRSQRTWLSDFADDQITISSDLYEVILAYQYYRRPSA